MGNVHTKVALVLILVMGIFLMRTQRTSADIFDEETISGNKFAATTLEISTRNSATFDKETSFFQLSGMKNGGFAVRGLRIKKDGKMNFHYHLSSHTNSESGNLCHVLTVSLYDKTFHQIYSGGLTSFQMDRDIDSSGLDEWIVLLALNTDLTGSSHLCNFDIVIKTYRVSADEKGGFYDKKILQNTITAN
ncbi:MAG: hypothetical protein NUV65_06300 [Candidatus Roizmanbacteria bacterium]|nr:hypothetical protein [Candidatus Roizmanbacteria bacterium]